MEAARVLKPAKTDGRICFGIEYYTTEEDAQERAAQVRAARHTYNGGMYHGRPCGRNTAFDHIDGNGQPMFAVTTS